jgi:hypothetical protein
MKDNSKHYQVIERIDGTTQITMLPKEQAERLYKKIRAKGGSADIVKVILR